jgi:hypothetical protein
MRSHIDKFLRCCIVLNCTDAKHKIRVLANMFQYVFKCLVSVYTAIGKLEDLYSYMVASIDDVLSCFSIVVIEYRHHACIPDRGDNMVL